MQLVRAAAGNPLALTELTVELDGPKLAGRGPLSEPLVPRWRRRAAAVSRTGRRVPVTRNALRRRRVRRAGVAGRFAVRFVDGEVAFGPPGEHPADCGITADPVAFLLVSTGRMSRWTAIALGLMRAGGPRPELAASFGDLFRFP